MKWSILQRGNGILGLLGTLEPFGSPWREKKTKPNVPTVAPTGEKKRAHTFSSPEKRTFGEGRPSQAGWVQVGPWKAVATNALPPVNVRVTFG